MLLNKSKLRHNLSMLCIPQDPLPFQLLEDKKNPVIMTHQLEPLTKEF